MDVFGSLVRQAGADMTWGRILVNDGQEERDHADLVAKMAPLLENARERQARGELPGDVDAGILTLVLFVANMAPVAIPHITRALSPIAPSDPGFVEYYAGETGTYPQASPHNATPALTSDVRFRLDSIDDVENFEQEIPRLFVTGSLFLRSRRSVRVKVSSVERSDIPIVGMVRTYPPVSRSNLSTADDHDHLRDRSHQQRVPMWDRRRPCGTVAVLHDLLSPSPDLTADQPHARGWFG